MKIQDFLDKLEKVRMTREHQWQACCPAHDDRTPSLSIALGDDERILLTCHAGCDVQSILQALHLEMKDLYLKPNKSQKPVNNKITTHSPDAGFAGTFEEFNKNLYPDLPGLIDWEELFTMPPYVQEWFAPFLIPKGKLISFFGLPKLGKSLLVLEAVAAIASGREFLGYPTQKAKVLYLDFENHPQTDIKPRLEAMGYKWDELDDLFYLSFPNVGFLDTPAGGEQLYKMVKRHGIELVIIDTIARITEGKENDNDTYNDLERYTERLLKRDGVTFLRIDHAGKTTGKGPRGASAKQGDVDITWLFEATKDGQLRLKSDGNRFPLEHNNLIISRRASPLLHHELISSTRKLKPTERAEILADLLDEQMCSSELTVKQTAETLRGLDEPVSNDMASNVVRIRHKRAGITSTLRKKGPQAPQSPPPGTWGWLGGSVSYSTHAGTRNNKTQTQCTKRFIYSLPTE